MILLIYGKSIFFSYLQNKLKKIIDRVIVKAIFIELYKIFGALSKYNIFSNLYIVILKLTGCLVGFENTNLRFGALPSKSYHWTN